MSDRLISADLLKKNCLITGEKACPPSKLDYQCVSLRTLCEVVDNQPTVDAEPVVHAHWIDGSGKGDTAVCSHCEECFDTTECELEWRKAFELFKSFYHYCPNCGARMDEVENNGE